MKKIGIIGCILCLGPISYLLLQGFTFLQSIEPLVVPFGICVVLIIIGIIREKKMTMEEKMNRERDWNNRTIILVNEKTICYSHISTDTYSLLLSSFLLLCLPHF